MLTWVIRSFLASSSSFKLGIGETFLDIVRLEVPFLAVTVAFPYRLTFPLVDVDAVEALCFFSGWVSFLVVESGWTLVASILVLRFLLPVLEWPARSPVTGWKFSLSKATWDPVALLEVVVKLSDEGRVTMAFGRVILGWGASLDTASWKTVNVRRDMLDRSTRGGSSEYKMVQMRCQSQTRLAYTPSNRGEVVWAGEMGPFQRSTRTSSRGPWLQELKRAKSRAERQINTKGRVDHHVEYVTTDESTGRYTRDFHPPLGSCYAEMECSDHLCLWLTNFHVKLSNWSPSASEETVEWWRTEEMYGSFHFMRPLFFSIVPRIFWGNSLSIGLLPITYLLDQAVQVAWDPFGQCLTSSCDRSFFFHICSLGMLRRQYEPSDLLVSICLSISSGPCKFDDSYPHWLLPFPIVVLEIEEMETNASLHIGFYCNISTLGALTMTYCYYIPNTGPFPAKWLNMPSRLDRIAIFVNFQ